MIIAHDYPALAQLLSSYFHEDWKMDARNYRQLVDEFRSSEPATLVSRAADEARALLATPIGDAELEQALDDLGCYLFPAGNGLTSREWLGEIAELLEAGREPS